MNDKNILERFDSASFGKFHLNLILLTGSCWVWAAYGATIVGFMLPSLQDEWDISASAFGVLAGIGMAGMLVGAILGGILSDRFGRRRMLTQTMILLGLLFMVSALSWNFASLLVLRFVTGLGMGAVLPVAGALVTELSPARLRGTLLVIVNGFWGLGGTLAALVGYGLILHTGWRPAMLFGGLSIVSGILIHIFLPESLRFLLGKGQVERALAESARVQLRNDPGVLVEADRPSTRQEQPAVVEAGIWSPAYARITFSLWVMWLGLNFLYQGVYIWLPTLLAGVSSSVGKSFLLTIFISMGQMPGTLMTAYLADRVGRRRLTMISLGLLGAATLFFSFSSNSNWILVMGFLLMVFNGMAWGIAYPFSSELYPTRVRGAATGWASGVGRLGGVAAPLIFGWVIQAGGGMALIFSMLSIAPILSILVLVGLRKETTGRSLEEISGN